MVVLLISFCLGTALVLLAGAMAYRPAAVAWFRPIGWGRELATRTNALVAALLIGLAGTQLTFLVGLPMGWAAADTEARFDKPVFRWVHGHASDHGPFTAAMKVLTKQGNILEIRALCVVGAIAIGLAWRRYFYLPALVILSTFILEKFTQKGLSKIIDRGHPPTTLGTYFSGGCARLLSIVGVMVFLALLAAPNLGRRWRVTVWTAFAVLVWCEAFSRLYLSKHWFTDVIAGVVLGVLLLLAVISATAALTNRIAPAFGGSVSFAPDPARSERAAEATDLGRHSLAATRSK